VSEFNRYILKSVLKILSDTYTVSKLEFTDWPFVGHTFSAAVYRPIFSRLSKTLSSF